MGSKRKQDKRRKTDPARELKMLSPYFAEFSPTQEQLKKLADLVKSTHKWYGIDYEDAPSKATFIVAPGELSRLTPVAYDLLRRCQNRVRAFKARFEDKYSIHRRTYGELIDLLLTLGLVEEAGRRQKLKGSRTVPELRSLLEARGLSAKGKKDALVDRVIEHLSPAELDALVEGVILFRTTPAGDQAIETIGKLRIQMGKAFVNAVLGTMRHFKASRPPPPTLPPGVLYDDGEVRITEEDVE